MQYRHEWKTEISYQDALLLRSRLDAVCDHDPHVGPDGCYHIRSIYFDNPDDKALRDNITGAAHRQKFRIRYYNGDLSFIQLEKKCKDNSLGYKLSASLSTADVQRIIDGDFGFLLERDDPLLRDLGEQMLHGLYAAKSIVEYSRIPYIYTAGNVRVTLDYDIRTGLWNRDFLDWNSLTIPAADICLLEVKYDSFIPDVIRDIVQLGNRRIGAFSKYAASRMFD